VKVATAFSGGLAACEWALKYEELEHEVVFACEWDKYARKQYLSFHGEPTSNFYEDIQDLDATPYLNKIDLFVFGSPCQDLSLAGKRKGFLGEKSSLFRHGARVLEEMMPKVFIFENVKGLLSSNKGADYAEVIKTFQDMGYLIQMKVLNAKEHGTAQNRERVFIVGFLDEDAYHAFNFEEPIPLTKVLRDYIDDEVEEKYYLSEKMIKGFIESMVATNIKDSVRKNFVRDYEEIIKSGKPIFYSDCESGFQDNKVCLTESACLRANNSDLFTLDRQFRIRRLIPRECGRLMGMRDEDINIVLSDSQAYKIFGNGIEINTIRSIVRGLYKPKAKLDTLF
jgi:DNA-cytosine methyltransferase